MLLSHAQSLNYPLLLTLQECLESLDPTSLNAHRQTPLYKEMPHVVLPSHHEMPFRVLPYREYQKQKLLCGLMTGSVQTITLLSPHS